MKRTAFLLLLTCILLNAHTQNWSWIKGSSNTSEVGIYGTKGVEAVSNNPGSRDAAFAFATNTHLYLFGGSGYAANTTYGPLNDLWSYNLTTGNWTWIGGRDTVNQYGTYGTQGIPGVNNIPSGRATGGSFADAAGNIWLFGGMGYTESNYGLNNDVWKYNIASGQWTWMKGSKAPYQNAVYGTKGVSAASNRPGARYEFAYTTDAAGNFWVYGGVGIGPIANSASGTLNDLWKYNPLTNQWTWVSGHNDINGLAVYGTKGVPAAANRPGGRTNAACWFDAAGDFWLFGGVGVNPSNTIAGHLNELWKFNTTTNQWTWMGGINDLYTPGIYGTQGVEASSNFPGARSRFNWFTDEAGCLWLFGGWGYGEEVSPRDYLNDVWRFDPVTTKWTWMKGSKFSNAPPSVSGMNTTLPTNTPAGRQLSSNWYVNGKLYVFGGSGYSNTSNIGRLDDLWKYDVYSTIYRFTGNGDWDNAAAWENGNKPPVVVPANTMVIINPPAGQECIISNTITFQKGARLVVPVGKKLSVTGKLILQ